MVMYNPENLNRYYAPGIAQFTAADLRDASGQFPDVTDWMLSLFMFEQFRSYKDPKQRQFVLNVVVRARAVLLGYGEARTMTREFIAKSGSLNPNSNLYFDALRAWEAMLLNQQMLMDIIKNMVQQKRALAAVSQETEQQIEKAANRIKHWGEDVRQGKCDPDHTVPLWLTNEGLEGTTFTLSFDELADVADAAGKLGRFFMNPKNYDDESLWG